MKINRTTTVSVLGLALLAIALPALANETVDLPAQSERIWAPTGDLVGQENHYAATFQSKDPHGNEAKGAEDWQLVQKNSGAGLFGWFHTGDTGSKYWVRASADNAGVGGLVGKFDVGGNVPGGFKWGIDFRDFDYFYDRTSEMRAPGFAAPPPPPELDSLPRYNWRRTSLRAAYHISDQFSVAAGFNRKCRQQDKGSLLRGFGNDGSAPPARKYFDTSTNEVWGGVGFATGSFGSDLKLAYRSTDGSRNLDDRHAYKSDQTRFNAQLDLSYALSEKFKLLGHGGTSKLEDSGSEVTGETYGINGETSTSSGQLGLLARLGKSVNLSASAKFQGLNTDARTSLAADVQQATDRKREKQDYRIALGYYGLAKTRLQLLYRYGTSNLDETVAQDDIPGGPQVGNFQVTDQTRNQQDLGFRGRYRFGPAATLKAMVGWQSLEIDEKNPATTGSVNPWVYWMGDRNRDRFRWELALRTRPWRTVRFDIGHQAIDQTFDRKDFAQSETTWKASRGFANLNWIPLGALSFYGMFSYGTEKYELTGDPIPAMDMNPIAYDGSTMRFTPGMTLQLTPYFHLESFYEGVRFEDKGNEDVIKMLQSDQDRFLVRAGYQFTPAVKLSATYTRNEFDENRWDDYIHHLYALSFSGTF